MPPSHVTADTAPGSSATVSVASEIEASHLPPGAPIQLLPQDALHNVLGRLSLREALACRPVCRLFRDALSSSPFLSSLPSLRLLALRHPRSSAAAAAAVGRDAHRPFLLALDPTLRHWIRLPLSFLPFPSASPVTASPSPSLLYLWVDASDASSGDFKSPRTLAVCNPLAGLHRLLPPLGSAWSRHGTVLAGPGGAVLVLTQLAALSYAPGSHIWLKFSLNLPSKPRSPILVGGSIFALCDVGTPWRSLWRLFSCCLLDLREWAPLERPEWGDVLNILKWPRLLAGIGGGRILMIGGLRSSLAPDAPCSTVLILRLDLATMEWDEAGRMPSEMYRCFGGGALSLAAAATGTNSKVKVFGGDGRVWFSGRKVKGKLAMWEEDDKSGCGQWSWVDGVPGCNEGVYRGFLFDAGFSATP
ncbi:SKP1-interacting partner 15-like [Canna indica]|uniref:SKP1-interacting partner 15-like n=1 Tax=Canna indica TaxID=4628 RepID=A0AAQ3JS98_9LILI|nr:SKP1-interacting partner 15-like [Canna indica]